MSRSRLRCHVFVDFDGTIVPQDATDSILERFADPSWQTLEASWKAGRINSRECLSQQVALIRATPAELDGVVASIPVDPGFPGFVAKCRNHGVDVTVVSDGYDRAISHVLANAGLPLSFKSNHLRYLGDRRWRIEFPNRQDNCMAAAGNCKCAAAVAAAPDLTMMVGDGRSDFCISARADFVLAKASLAHHCAKEGLPHAVFSKFTEATDLLQKWFAQHGIEPLDRSERASSRVAYQTPARATLLPH